MTDNCVLWYDEWQMSCCGSYFTVGSKVIWPVSKDMDYNYLPPEMREQVGTIDFYYDSHASSFAGMFTLAGTIKKIQGVYLHFKPDPENPNCLRPESGYLTDMENCDFWSMRTQRSKKSAKRPQASFEAYIIQLDNIELNPFCEGDQNSWT